MTSTDETPPIDILPIDAETLSSIMAGVQDWITRDLLTFDTTIQMAIITCAFIAGAVVARIVSPRISAAIEALRLPMGLRKTLQNLRRLTGVAMALLFLFLSALLHAIIGWKISFYFVEAVMNLSAAWIIIRMAVQVVQNPAMRTSIAMFIWAVTALSIFGYLDDTAKALDGFAITLGELRLSALTVTKAVIVTLILLYAATGLCKVVEYQLGKIPSITPGSRLLVLKVVRIMLYAAAIMIGVTLAGINLAMLAVFSGAVGLGIGLGLQRSVSNLFTGMTLLLDRSIQPGDLIEMPDGTLGTVYHMGSRCIELRALDNRSYLIPNEQMVSNQVINWSRGSPDVAQRITFGVDYKHNPREIIQIAVDAAKGINRTIRDPACLFTGFGDSSLDFMLIFWVSDPQNGTGGVKSDVFLALWDAFEKNGIEIPYPHRKILSAAE